jgi:hypothetical protein
VSIPKHVLTIKIVKDTVTVRAIHVSISSITFLLGHEVSAPGIYTMHFWIFPDMVIISTVAREHIVIITNMKSLY